MLRNGSQNHPCRFLLQMFCLVRRSPHDCYDLKRTLHKYFLLSHPFEYQMVSLHRRIFQNNFCSLMIETGRFVYSRIHRSLKTWILEVGKHQNLIGLDKPAILHFPEIYVVHQACIRGSVKSSANLLGGCSLVSCLIRIHRIRNQLLSGFWWNKKQRFN